jgi:hypothetical protein
MNFLNILGGSSCNELRHTDKILGICKRECKLIIYVSQLLSWRGSTTLATCSGKREIALIFHTDVTVMKEVSRKFSSDEHEPSNEPGRLISLPERDGRPANLDLRFVVKESFNLGFRFFDEVDRMLQKFKEDEPEKKPKNPESKEGEAQAEDPS